MISLILYLSIFIGGIGSGYLAARSFENRVIHLDDLILTLKTVRAEMEYRSDPLPVLLEQVGQRTGNKAGIFLIETLNILKENKGSDFYESWKKAVSKVYEESALKEEDKLILSQLGLELGKTDMANQHAMFIHTFNGLERMRKEADEERKTKGKVYMTLGTAFGVLTIIILL